MKHASATAIISKEERDLLRAKAIASGFFSVSQFMKYLVQREIGTTDEHPLETMIRKIAREEITNLTGAC